MSISKISKVLKRLERIPEIIVIISISPIHGRYPMIQCTYPECTISDDGVCWLNLYLDAESTKIIMNKRMSYGKIFKTTTKIAHAFYYLKMYVY